MLVAVSLRVVTEVFLSCFFIFIFLLVCIGYLFGVRWVKLYLELDWSFHTLVHMHSREAFRLLLNDIFPPVLISCYEDADVFPFCLV